MDLVPVPQHGVFALHKPLWDAYYGPVSSYKCMADSLITLLNIITCLSANIVYPLHF